ncbi:MAG: hypothetical protein IT245_03075 [Bacteroidia bacterium]|nr:hypothetical protein [Bacteroidia bacterium]
MKQGILFVLSVIIGVVVKGQTEAPTKSMPSYVSKVVTKQLIIEDWDTNMLILEMSFNGSIPKHKLDKIPISRIASVTLAYSRYRLSETFNQIDLNNKRMDMLFAQLPGLRNNTSIDWYWAEQTGCLDPTSCQEYFHGFIIQLKDPELGILKEAEIALLDYYSSIYEGLRDSKKMDSLIATGKTTYVKQCDTMTLRTLIKGNKLPKARSWDKDKIEQLSKALKTEFDQKDTIEMTIYANEKGEYEYMENIENIDRNKRVQRLFRNNFVISPGKYEKKKVPSKVALKIFKSKNGYKMSFMAYPIVKDSVYMDLDKFLYLSQVETVCDYLDTSIVKVGKGLFSSTPDIVIKVLDRNKNWKNCLVATDVTASMYPYLAQFQMWHKINLETNTGNHDFIFFNDGDNKPNIIKITGQVGGLYYLNTSSYETLSITMKKAMLRGNGGDRPENNLEAVIEGLKKNPSIKEVVMIADNFATPRDLELIKTIKVPIHLILCGIHTSKGINPAYLNMIRANKGSIHTMNQDIYDLSKFTEGQSIKIENNTYRLIKGEFVKVSTDK